MNVRNLKKTLRSTTRGGVPAELRDRLIGSIPADFGPVRAGSHPFKFAGRRLIYLAVAASVLVAALHLAGLLSLSGSGSRNMAGSSFNLVSSAVADVIKNLEGPAALYMELDQRSRRGENFEYVDPKSDFSRVNIWLERPSERFRTGRMKIEREGDRSVIFNGKATLFYLSKSGDAKFYNGGRVDTQLSDPARWIKECLPTTGASANLDTTVSQNGATIARLTIREKGIPPNPGYAPVFFMEFDRRTVICWETITNRLTDLEKYVTWDGREALVSKLQSIAYRDRFDDEIFSHKLPDGVHVAEVADPGNKQYAEMGPEEVARFIFNAWVNEEWDKVSLFCEYKIIIEYMKRRPLASFRITGSKFKRNPLYPGWQVPYELVFKDGHTKRWALAVRNDNPMKRYIFDGGL